MEVINSISNYIRFLKRLNYSKHTIKHYFNVLQNFTMWLEQPVELVQSDRILEYVEFLLDKGLLPQTINCYLDIIHGYYEYLYYEEKKKVINPVKSNYTLRVSRPLPRFLEEEEVEKLFGVINKLRDQAIFLLMLRSGLRVEEVANLTFDAIDFLRRKIIVKNGKWGRESIVFISNDVHAALLAYIAIRPVGKTKKLFLVEKGSYRGKPISVRGIQKRIEYYARKSSIKCSCHRLRHTMANLLLNADAKPTTIQELLGHVCTGSIQRYCKASNPKVQRDYFRAMETVMQRTTPRKPDDRQYN
jgi:site-specific recombinase XerD